MTRVTRLNRRYVLSSGASLAAIALAACGGAAGEPAKPAATLAPQAGASGAAGSAPTSAPTSAPAVPDREVVIAVSRDLGNGPQDPFFFHSSAMVWEPLVGLDNALKPTPVLAEKWDLSPDGKVWTFKLRQGVKLSDGSPFDATVALKNMQRYMKISPRSSPYFNLDVKIGYGQLTEVKAPDASTLVFELAQPAPFMPATMSAFFSAMFSPASFADNGDFTGPPIATGPFKALEWKRDEYMVLERNDNYWGAKPAVKRIRLRVIPDANARLSSLVAKEVDGIAELGALLPAQAQQLKSQPGITVGADPISISQYLAFNCSKPPFDDVKLRQAVAMMVDRDTIVKDLVLGYATPGKSLLSPVSTQWFSPKGTPKFDPAAAQKLAQEALAGKRVTVTLPFSSSAGQARPYKQTGEYIQSILRPLGIELQLQALENAALTDVTSRGEWHLRFGQQGWANGDPDFIFSSFTASTGSYNTTNKAGYKNQEVDDLVAQGKQERDEKKRFAIYERLQELAVQDMPVLPLYHELSPYASRDTISGLKQRVTYQPTLETIKLVK